MHFQFVMANERPHAYDVFMIVCGPVALPERMARPAAALTVVTMPEAPEYELAWSALAVFRPARTSAAPDVGATKEQPARSRG